MHKLLIIFIVFTLFYSVHARTWKDVDGHTLEVEFVSSKNGIVSLETENGKIVRVPLKKLIDDHKKHIKALLNKIEHSQCR